MNNRTWRWLVCGLVVAVTGCAEGGVTPAISCMTDEDCAPNQRCNVLDGVCLDVTGGSDEEMGTSGEDMDMNPQVSPDLPVVLDMGGEEMGPVVIVPDFGTDMGPPVDMMTPVDMAPPEDMNPPVDMAPPEDMRVDPCLNVSCAPRDNVCQGGFLLSYGAGVCADGMCTYSEDRIDCTAMNNRKCENGACVDRECDPACEAPGTCNAGTCSYPGCMAEGDACDTSTTDQGNFLCLIDDATTNAAHCYSKCPAAGSGVGCDVGQRCFAAVTNAPDLLICLDSECSSNNDCNGGTCIRFENSFGYCEPGGAVPVGGTCNPGADQWCQQGATCDTGGNATGTCERVCDPWSGTTCGATQYCAVFTSRMGICTGPQDATGTGPYEQCSTAGSYCDDATPCINNGGTNICIKYCRPNSADCAGIASSVTCDNYIFPGDRTLGICNAVACTSSAECSASADCVGGQCRERCVIGNEVNDCGSSAWSCVGGYCE